MPPMWFLVSGGLGSVLILVWWLLQHFLIVVVVEGRSMSPTLEPGDRVIAVRHWPARWLRKGDIILIHPWHSSSSGARSPAVNPFIKRIVGLGGEILAPASHEATASSGLVSPNANDQQHQWTWQIPAGALFVCGDNRADSLDSRHWGSLPLKNVLGVVVRKIPGRIINSSSSTVLPQAFSPPLGLTAGQEAPAFVAQTLQGETVTLATYRGCSVVFVFFAPSDFCRNVLMQCSMLAPKAAAIGITLVLVSSTGEQPTRPFVEGLNIGLPILIAPRRSNRFLKKYHVSSTPAYCFINEQAIVQSAGLMNMRWGAWKALAESWIGQELPIPDDKW